MRMKKFSLTRPNVVLCALSVIVLLILGLSAPKCNRGGIKSPQTVILTDTVFADSTFSDSTTTDLKTQKSKRGRSKKEKIKKPTVKPSSRNYRDERID